MYLTTISCYLLSARLSTICHSFDRPLGGVAVGCDKRYLSDKKNLLIGVVKTDAYKVDRVMPREAANCTAVLTESLLQSS